MYLDHLHLKAIINIVGLSTIFVHFLFIVLIFVAVVFVFHFFLPLLVLIEHFMGINFFSSISTSIIFFFFYCLSVCSAETSISLLRFSCIKNIWFYFIEDCFNRHYKIFFVSFNFWFILRSKFIDLCCCYCCSF